MQRNLKASLHTAPPQMNKIILSSLSYGVIRVESSHCLVLLFFSKQKHYKDYEMGSRITFFCQELLSRMWWFQFQTDKMQFCQQRKIWKTVYIKFMVDAQLYKWWWVGRVETRRKVVSLVTNFDRVRARSPAPPAHTTTAQDHTGTPHQTGPDQGRVWDGVGAAFPRKTQKKPAKHLASVARWGIASHAIIEWMNVGGEKSEKRAVGRLPLKRGVRFEDSVPNRA